jgi:uncharacterized protein
MFETLGVRCERGGKAMGRAPIGELRDGTPVTLPVRVVHGAEDGPTLCLTGAIHGDEPNGLAAINRLCDELDPAALAGTVIGFPIASPFAFITKSRISSLDYERLNLNRVFPGNGEGLITERVAAAIFEGGIRRASCHLDFHEGGYDFIARYLIAQDPEGDARLAAENLRLARAFGMGVPVNVMKITETARRLGRAGTTTVQANEIGIPSLCNELGGAGRVWPTCVDEAVHGTRNVMKELGMLTGDKVTVDAPQLFGTDSRWPRPTRGGWWEQVVELGQVVEEGQPVGHVRDAFGQVVEELKAPFRSVVFDVRNTAAIMTGEWTVHCGRLVE